MIEPILSLAFSMHANKGVYALLLGSGVSRSAQIPTGWEITIDLTRQLAALQGKDCDGSPEAWYFAEYQKEPDYCEVLEAIAKSPAERAQKLRAYFEPTEEDREEGRKQPQEAHRAIAKLVARGYVRVILTTNFDPLIELAIQDEGISPIVIDTADKVEGAVPLTHSPCTLIKLNGDYRDIRIKNTQTELASTEPKLGKLLDQVFDEYGLIVCGWSGDWDLAIRTAMERCPSRRYTTYWAAKASSISESAQALCKHRRAEILTIADADAFFSDLESKVMALEEYNRPHPMSTQMTITLLKRYMAKDEYRIALNDLLQNAGEVTINRLNSIFTSLSAHSFTDTDFEKVVIACDGASEEMISLLAFGSYWGQPIHQRNWIKGIERLANFKAISEGKSVWIDFQKYPALLALYACGIACVASENYETLSGTWFKSKYYSHDGEKPAIARLLPGVIMDKSVINPLVNKARKTSVLHNYFVPASEWLQDQLRTVFKELLPDDREYETCFDATEYLLGISIGALKHKETGHFRAPVGAFHYHDEFNPQAGAGLRLIEAAIKTSGAAWPFLFNDVFEGDLKRFRSMQEEYATLRSHFPTY